MRTPGFGDSNWTDVISELRLAGYHGSIDIEGWHDPVYRDALEMTGQVRALNYLKALPGRRTSWPTRPRISGRKRQDNSNTGVNPARDLTSDALDESKGG